MTATTDARVDADRRLTGADGLRAFAALWVVFSHLYQRLNMPEQSEWLQNVQTLAMKGAFGVSIFFVLSGMLLSFPFWKAYLSDQPYPSIGRYVKRRAARIVPGFYASLLVSFAVSLAIFPDAPHQVLRLLSGLTFTSGFHYTTFFPTESNGPLWSIGFEVVSYVLMPLAMWGMFALGRRGRRIGAAYWVVVFIATIALNQWVITTFTTSPEGSGWGHGLVGGAKEWMPEYNPIGFFGHFAIGVMAAGFMAAWRVYRGGQRRWRFDLAAALALLLAAALVWVFRWPAEPFHVQNFQGQPYLFPWFAGLIAVALATLAYSRVLGRIIDNPFARYTAKISFGIYIWHYLVLHLVSYLTQGQFEYFGIDDPVRHTWLSIAVLIMTYGIASASWFLLERPVLQSRWATRAPADTR